MEEERSEYRGGIKTGLLLNMHWFYYALHLCVPLWGGIRGLLCDIREHFQLGGSLRGPKLTHGPVHGQWWRRSSDRSLHWWSSSGMGHTLYPALPDLNREHTHTYAYTHNQGRTTIVIMLHCIPLFSAYSKFENLKIFTSISGQYSDLHTCSPGERLIICYTALWCNSHCIIVCISPVWHWFNKTNTAAHS